MSRIRLLAPALLLFTLSNLGSREILACSTFLLKSSKSLVIGHNLDQEFHTPGALFVNPRGTRRRSVSGQDLGLDVFETHVIHWKSRYGSVTFSYLGVGLPDAGINEAGLVINEMALGQSEFPFDPRKPTLLIHQWIQYQLDQFSTVEEVLRHLDEINIDPRSTFSPVSMANYHFFIADRRGSWAAIEFLDGQPVVHEGSPPGVPVLCNLPYRVERKRYERLGGLGGWIRSWLAAGTDQRWMIGAAGLEDYEPISDDAVAFTFDLLAKMQYEHTRQWSVAYDILNRRIHFRTAGYPGIKSLNLDSLDFSEAGESLVLDQIDTNESGEIAASLVSLTECLNGAVIERFLENLIQFVSKAQTARGRDQYLLQADGVQWEEFLGTAQQVSLKSTSILHSGNGSECTTQAIPAP